MGSILLLRQLLGHLVPAGPKRAAEPSVNVANSKKGGTAVTPSAPLAQI
jgi:hypothetical protein